MDLDGTLVRTDTSFEQFFGLVRKNPGQALVSLFILLSRGRARFKEFCTRQFVLSAEHLPFNSEVIALVRRLSPGRKCLLVSGAHQKIVNAVSNKLGLFDEAIGSVGDVNLISNAKAALLVVRFGERGYDYVGNSRADFKVWEHAQEVVAVSNSSAFLQRVLKLFPHAQVVPIPGSGLADYFSLLRVEHWSKNLLVLLPLFAAHKWGQTTLWQSALIASLATCIAASIGYIWNDLLDLESDRASAVKCRRAMASGRVEPNQVWRLALALFAGLCLLAMSLPPFCQVAIAAYLLGSVCYSTYFKRFPLFDVLFLAWLYILRVYIGGFATGVTISAWLYLFILFISLSLALLKRFLELRELGLRDGGQALAHFGRPYKIDDREPIYRWAQLMGLSSILVLGFYIGLGGAAEHYLMPQRLWLLLPILLFWYLQLWSKIKSGCFHVDVIPGLLRDVSAWLMAIAAFSILIWAAG